MRDLCAHLRLRRPSLIIRHQPGVGSLKVVEVADHPVIQGPRLDLDYPECHLWAEMVCLRNHNLKVNFDRIVRNEPDIWTLGGPPVCLRFSITIRLTRSRYAGVFISSVFDDLTSSS